MQPTCVTRVTQAWFDPPRHLIEMPPEIKEDVLAKTGNFDLRADWDDQKLVVFLL